MNVKLLVNQEHNGLELYFPDRPEEHVLDALKSAHWRYHRVKKCWYARHTESNHKLALQFAGNELAAADAKSGTSTIENVPYFPPYDIVSGIPVCKSSDLSCWDSSGGYFQDINAFVTVGTDRITIVDLTYALIPGKECVRITMTPVERYSPTPINAGLDTFRAVYEAFFVRREKPVVECNVHEARLKSMQVFTPFKKIRPVRQPSRWTIPHVWKAILSGQIYEGHCSGRYTDDYAYDAAVNFRSGAALHLPSFAKKLIEDSSGWHVYCDKADGNQVQLSVDCYTFDTNVLQFDASCDWPETLRRSRRREQERLAHNAKLERQRLTVEEATCLAGKHDLLDVQHLSMDQNTDLYEIESELMLRQNLFYNTELTRDVISLKPHDIDDMDLFEIDCASELEDDARIILTADHAVVSGRALRELLSDAETACRIRDVCLRQQTWEQLRKTLEDWRCGRVQRLLAPIPRERFAQSLARLARELERIHGGEAMEQPAGNEQEATE